MLLQLKDYFSVSRESISEDAEKKLKKFQDIQSDLEEAVKKTGKFDGLELEDVRYQQDLPTLMDFLNRSMIINLFSYLDAFIGDISKLVLKQNPNLGTKLGRNFTYSDLAKVNDVESLRRQTLDNEIDRIRRGSYKEIFKELGSMFNVALGDFKRWENFIELSQRRNLLTHNDGVVSQQYLNEVSYEFTSKVCLNGKVVVDAGYVEDSIDLIFEIILLVSQSIFRKNYVNDLPKANEFLIQTIFMILSMENWQLAQKLSEYGCFLIDNFPNQLKSLEKKILKINAAQAYKWAGDSAAADKCLNDFDWSSSNRNIQLAEKVLRDNFDKAYELMEKIGKEGELINEEAYYHWPLFREVKKEPKFKETLKSIYGKSKSEDKKTS
ncbi:hypothetical protein [Pseudobacteriovorax antillogorgiicola]|uniref:Uncharacterized protein n=1 Tax=Pseudobacteriovorax antillogorgiicola TaxID=1513793 RepID=A0A1Y6BVE5_9BACT|nr:hypothetical protein [Pseudobacteriovorax antillogorgiicola]TCS53712.1 hypothetical protein EDD56_10721 [Pseudobacteriovorax antillogorgiicola]SMF22929.1 hypothetical protein SAMN06296036_107251 [Pseudobacteriovorax antillogorgiicola]